LHILADDQERLAARERLALPPESCERLLLALLWREIESRIAPIDVGQGE